MRKRVKKGQFHMKHVSLRQSIYGSVALSTLMFAGGAYAQENGDEPVVIEQPTETEARQEKITVTGSLLARDEFTSASPVQVITAEVATLEGLVDTADLLQGSSLAAGATQLNNTFQNYVTNGGVGTQTLDLRGCGDTRTLVLIDGKRPGPSGTRGAVSAVDLNNIPQSIVSRVEILKDGASTIYGSDAVCGVVNVITRNSVDGLELNLTGSIPQESGGETFRVSGAYGFEWGENADFTISAEYRKDMELNIGDRSYLSCPTDRVIDPLTGANIGRLNYSATAASPQDQCNNIYHNTVIDAFSGQRLVPSPDGGTVPLVWGTSIPGYQPRTNGTLPNGLSYYEDILDAPFVKEADYFPENENLSIFGTADVDIAGMTWDTELLYNKRTTRSEGFRQFFPYVGSNVNPAGNPAYGYIATDANGNPIAYDTYNNSLFSLVRPVMPYPSNTEIEVEYYHASTSLSGDYGNIQALSEWSWKVDGSYSRSEGSYTNNQITVSRSGDWGLDGVSDFTGDGVTDYTGPPTIDYLDPQYLSGANMAGLVAAVGGNETGNTVYEQKTITATTAGELFDLYAGPVGLALGLEYREIEIDDTPGPLTQIGDVWGRSTAGPTRGTNSVFEYFAETSIPLLKGQPFAEDVELSASWRGFEYDIGGSDSIYKVGLNWQVNPVFRVRASQGTSYRAPALFELFLEEQTSFASQASVDPCDNWGDSTNQNIRANCAAAGIPSNYSATGSSALVIESGGGELLRPETGDTFTAGIVYTPTFADINIALDYYEIEINDQITSLGASTVVGGCYASQNFPNSYCDLFDRAPGTDPVAPYAIDNIQAPTLNVDSQQQRGIDLEVRYEKEFNFGTVTVDAGVNWSLERYIQVFGSSFITGINDNDFNGTVGFPNVVGDALITLDRGDWTYSWFVDYVGRQDDNRYFTADLNQPDTYFGLPALYDVNTEAQFTHGASVRWQGDTWTLAGGVRNLFDEEPPQVSDVIATSAGNTPLSATAYPVLGRTFFVNISKTF